MKPSHAVSRHAEQRARQRWDIEISVDEIERQIAAGEAEVYERENARIWKLLIRTAVGLVPIVYDFGLKTVLTVLPREELAYIQEEYGCGFTNRDEKIAFFRSLSAKRLREIEARQDECRLLDPGYNIGNVRRAQKIMDFVDSLPPDVRAVVHEYGHHLVQAYWGHGFRHADEIAILIEASRKAKSADSQGLAALYRHFGAKSDASAHYLATVARNEPPPNDPTQNPFRQEKPKGRRQNACAGKSAA